MICKCDKGVIMYEKVYKYRKRHPCCNYCKHLEITGCYGECDRGYLGIVRPDCYCCYGERRE